MTGFVDFATLERPKSPNHFLVAPAGFADKAKPDEESPEFPIAPDDLFARMLDLVESRKDWRLQASDRATRQLAFVAVTRLMRFKDDVDVVILPAKGAPDRSAIAVYSRSRIGHSDLGANRKRVQALLESLGCPN